MGASSIKRSLGVDLTSTIHQSRVLLVGAGGIGCELLKNLVLTGFGEIHIIDLDTIDLSNLNRQFLFRHEHIKKSKAIVAKEVAHKFKPSAKLEAYHANIMDSQFHVDWFKSFNIVFNALDNLAARRHVNHMCLAAGVPLVESGTTGFNGQVQVIEEGKTECYDCNPKEIPKSFPICTIRSTPSQPIHCIVWAKSYLLPVLFGESDDTADAIDDTTDADNAKEIEELQRESQALKDIRSSLGSDEFPRKVFDKVFKDDIERLRGAEDLWKERSPPGPLDFDNIQEESSSVDSAVANIDQRVWALGEGFAVFKDSLDRLSKRLQQLQEKTPAEDPAPTLSFDKDDVDTLDFVTATANLRAHIFNIQMTSKFDTKQMAGNIIPAIATTNAMTAGLCVLQAFKVLQGKIEEAKMVFLERSGARAINSDALNPPQPDCAVCAVARGRLTIISDRATLQDFVERVLQQELGYSEELSITTRQGLVYDPELEDLLPKKLSELNIKDQTFITIVDEDDQNKDPRVNLELLVVQRTEPAEDANPVVISQVEIPRKPRKPLQPATEDETTNGNGTTAKRKRDDTEEDVAMTNGHVPKKVAGEVSTNGNGDGGKEEPILLDEQESAILIDD
ncbi:ubiquitin-like activating enzyme [Penicillium capsulatum]|uniref:Ubiquitin-activating enzyme E1-like n=1 Tax=Penicillium capsulatum TaxID=69766 RepID=A0A9W9M061_9EURO|nr:ubiquitin-like activating enzyme [Penicillium capsulatum]KAJ6129169.1 ubiquitin-like activating enzyme [Penicillium capsulatum]